MRFSALLLAAVLIAAGCSTRDNAAVTPDRQGHARVIGYANISAGPVAQDNEMYYTTKAGDTLTSVAKQFNTTAGFLISRNNLSETTGTNKLTPGQNLIVPKPGTTAPKR